MKALKTFSITLGIILAVGAIAIAAGIIIKKNNGAGIDTRSATTSVGNSTADSTTNSKRKSKANPITKAVVSEALDSYVSGADDKTKEIYNSMSEEDKDIVVDIIAENVSLGSVSDVSGYIANGDKDALVDYAQENLPEEDQKELLDILSKYGLQP